MRLPICTVAIDEGRAASPGEEFNMKYAETIVSTRVKVAWHKSNFFMLWKKMILVES
jgi:hypothetical protein